MASLIERIEIRNRNFLAPACNERPTNFVEIRKKHRNENLIKRRKCDNSLLTEIDLSLIPKTLKVSYPDLFDEAISSSKRFLSLIEYFNSEDSKDLLDLAQGIRVCSSNIYKTPKALSSPELVIKLLDCLETGSISLKYESL